MYKVLSTLSGDTVAIHGKLDPNAQIKDGTIKEYVNAIPTFGFTIFPNNPGYNSIENMLTIIDVTDRRNNERIFKGRVYSTSDSMSAEGEIYKSVTCEGELAYLCDIIIESYSRAAGTTFESAISTLLDAYNLYAGASKKIYAYSSIPTGALPAAYSASYKTAFEILKDLCDMCEYEFRLIYSDDTRYLQVAQQFGTRSSTDIALSVNMKALQRNIEAKDIVTMFYPLGINKDNDSYFTIAAANSGVPFLTNASLYDRYGRIEASKVYDDITIEDASHMSSGAKKLKAAGQKDYAQMIGLLTSFTISVLDLSIINGNYEDLRLYNTHRVITKIQGIDDVVRITGRTLKLDEPQNPQLTFGVKQQTLTSMIAGR